MPYKRWQYLEKVASADFQTYLQDQVIPQFTSTTQRDAQWTAPPVGAMCITTDTLTRWIYNGTAWITLSYAFYNARAYRAAALTLATTPTLIVMDTKSFDASNSFDTATGRYTCKVAGQYLVRFQMGATLGAAYTANVNIYRNGVFATVANAYQANGALIVGVSDLLVCAIGDTIEPRGQSNVASTGLRTGSTDTSFYVAYLGP